MKSIKILDCTLRDGGYINDWQFGEKAIKHIVKKLADAGIDIVEVGFIKGTEFNKDRTIFPSIKHIENFVKPKNSNVLYAGMIDLGNPISIEKLTPYNGESVDIIRIIFKKNKISEAFEYCKLVQKQGYKIFVQPVGIDNYDDSELVELIRKFNILNPDAFYIVDSFGLISKKEFSRLLYIADNNLEKHIALGYHSHNNMQQAYGNAQVMAEMNLNRDLIMDASVYGMGRGAGNLNTEIFATYLNQYYNRSYRVEPMLEIIDLYLQKIFMQNFWGYSMPLYLSALNNCHPNYAIYFSEKNTLNVKSMNEILRTMDLNLKSDFSNKNAEKIYSEYQQNFVDDNTVIEKLKREMMDRKVMILASGKSIDICKDKINKFIEKNNPIIISVNFETSKFDCDYLFCSNQKRFDRLNELVKIKRIVTSNIINSNSKDYVVNYASILNDIPGISDNSTLMVINLLIELGFKEVSIAGFDGYSLIPNSNYVDLDMMLVEKDETKLQRNEKIKNYVNSIKCIINIEFITPSLYIS